MRLAQDQLEHFRREGYLLSKGFLEAEEIAHLRDCYTEIAARLQAEQALENVQSGGDRDEDFQVYQIRTAHLRHPIFRMLINDSRLLDLVECLIGPDIRLIHYQGLYKPAATGGAVGWHQDNYYFNVAGERTVSVWMALDDATIANGCMWYLPGRHGARMAHNSGTARSRRVSISGCRRAASPQLGQEGFLFRHSRTRRDGRRGGGGAGGRPRHPSLPDAAPLVAQPDRPATPGPGDALHGCQGGGPGDAEASAGGRDPGAAPRPDRGSGLNDARTWSRCPEHPRDLP